MVQHIHEDLLSKKYTCESLISERVALAKQNIYNANVLVLEEKSLQSAKKVDEKIAAGEKI
jgi:aspartyl-tRNA(Asn)/glutamyl-tRNA(Gln) amidotransferase subunit A